MPQDQTAQDQMAAEDYSALIRESAASYVDTSNTLARARAQMSGSAFDRNRWSELAELGWLGLAVPEVLGGAGLGMGELTALLEELGKGLLPEPITLCSVLPARAAVLCEGPAAAQLVSEIIAGTTLVSVAWQGKAGVLSAEDTLVQCVADGDGYRLDGGALFVPAALHADTFLVAARSENGVGLYRVAKDAAKLTLMTSEAADGSTFATLRFDGVHVLAAARIGRPGEGRVALEAALDEARIALSAEMLGASEVLFQRTLDYLRVRKQFGRAIGSFQALQHRAVDLHIQIELSRAAVTRAARIFDATAETPNFAATERAAAASACKARLSEAALIVAREAVQLHGAIAYTDEHDIGIFLNHALVRSALLGNAPVHRRRFGLLTAKLRAA